MASIFKLVFGVLGNITALCLFLSPMPTFWRIVKMKKVEDFSGVPYVTALLNTSIWTLYGLPVVNFQVLVVTINAAGAGLEFAYVVIYLLFSDREPRMRVAKLLMAVAAGFILMSGLVIGFVQHHDERRIILGILGILSCCIMYAAPLTIMTMVIRTKSVEFMPFLLSLFIFLNSSAWFIYGIVTPIDIYISVPNGIGSLLGTAQLFLYAVYRRSTPPKQLVATLKNFTVDTSNLNTSEKIVPAADTKEDIYVPVKMTAPDNV